MTQEVHTQSAKAAKSSGVRTVLAWTLGLGWFRPIEQGLARLSRHRRASILTVGLAAFGLSAALSLLVRFPQPSVHDEFSYLLAADTFARGRLTNPTHPMWVHFESMHIIHQPSYASKYPPAQGMVMAFGQVVFGHPIVGVWLSVGLGCAAICWMLMGWMPARWALLGGLLSVFHPLILSWGQKYWGGAVAMMGGALVLGAFRRLIERPAVGDSILLGLGVSVLANSRPYEGLVLTLVVGGRLVWWMFSREGPGVRAAIRSFVAPVCLVLAINFAAIGYYNLRVTGSVWSMPHTVHEATYAMAPPLIFLPARYEPEYRHKEIRELHARDLSVYKYERSVGRFLVTAAVTVLALLFASFRMFGLVVPMAAFPVALEKDRWLRFALLATVLFAVGLVVETWHQFHYSSPVIGLVFLFSLSSMRHLRRWCWRGWRLGRLATRLGVLLCLTASALWLPTLGDSEGRELGVERARLLADLKLGRDRHLVVVRYSDGHSPYDEWVYNEASIDEAKVVWAREMDLASNAELLKYFKDRRAWLLEADSKPHKLFPYPKPRGPA